MKHLDKLRGTASSRFLSGKDLVQRATGRFYTPGWMAQQLVERLLLDFRAEGSVIRAVDPFSGDGRLLVALVARVSQCEKLRAAKWHFEIWDNDAEAVTQAKGAVASAIRSSKLKAIVRVRKWDSFFDSMRHLAAFDLVVTNPPWEALKPDSRELTGLSSNDRRDFEIGLRDYDRRLAANLPNSQPTAKLYGWGTNLSRCGFELAIKLLRHGGRCGIVLPASTLADQVSAPLRKWLLQEACIRSIHHYPAESKPFDGVDQPSIFMILQRQEDPGRFAPLLVRHDRTRAEIAKEQIRLTAAELDTLDFRIPTDLNDRELALLLKLSRYRPLSDWEVSRGGKLWMGRELDETGYRSFITDTGKIAFAKGRDVSRFAALNRHTDFIKDGARQIPPSVRYQRVAWRDVSRRSQVRRMLATIIPCGVATGNSLHVAYFVDDNQTKLRALLGILNSLVFEFQLRSRLGTGHVSLGVVREVRVPQLNDGPFLRKLSYLVQQALAGDTDAEMHIESTIADALSLSEDERDALVNYFPGLQGDLRNKFRHVLVSGGVNGKKRK